MLKLAERGARVAVHYYQNEDAAKNALAKIRDSRYRTQPAKIPRLRDDTRRVFVWCCASESLLEAFLLPKPSGRATIYI